MGGNINPRDDDPKAPINETIDSRSGIEIAKETE